MTRIHERTPLLDREDREVYESLDPKLEQSPSPARLRVIIATTLLTSFLATLDLTSGIHK